MSSALSVHALLATDTTCGRKMPTLRKDGNGCQAKVTAMCIEDRIWFCKVHREAHSHKDDAGGTLETRPAPHGRPGPVASLVGA